MSNCKNKQFKEMRHAYELNLLSPEDMEHFEQHMFDCDDCFNAVQSFHKASQHLLQSEDLRQIAEDTSKSSDIQSVRPKRKFWSTLIPAAAIILLVLILKPWKIEIHTDDEVIASENRLVIACFANLAERDETGRLGEAVSNLLITDLAESQYLQVVSSQRVYDILKGMGLPEECQIDPEISTEIAEKANAKWLLTGSIIRDEPEMVITSQLIDVATGNTVATQIVSSDSIQNIFSLVDKLTVEVKQDLILPVAAMSEPDRMVAEVTTHSAEAYAYYLDGISNKNKFYHADAADAFLEAVKIDTTFAMAYYHLADLKDKKYIKLALQYIDQTSHKEQLFIQSRAATYNDNYEESIQILEELVKRFPDEKEAYFLIGNSFFSRSLLDSAIQYYLRVIEIDPFYKLAYNQMAYTYNTLNEYQKSLWAINKYIDIAPNEANPYDSRGEIYAKMGMIDESVESYKMAIEIKPDFIESWNKLGILYLFKDQPEAAKNCFIYSSEQDQMKSWFGSETYIASSFSRVYNFDNALNEIDLIHKKYNLDSLPPLSARNVPLTKALVYREMGNYEKAMASLDECKQFNNSVADLYNNALYIQFALEAGMTEKAKERLSETQVLISTSDFNGDQSLAYIDGCMALHQGDYAQAIEHFSISGDLCKERKKDICFQYNSMMAYSYLQAERYEEAIVEYRQLMSEFNAGRAFWSLWDIKGHYYLAQAYEATGQLESAVEQYTKFLSVRQDNAPDHPAIVDAQKRLRQIEKNL